jgi:hypothetical protein
MAMLPPHNDRRRKLRDRAALLRRLVRAELDPARRQRLLRDLAETVTAISPPMPNSGALARFAAP